MHEYVYMNSTEALRQESFALHFVSFYFCFTFIFLDNLFISLFLDWFIPVMKDENVPDRLSKMKLKNWTLI